MHGIKAGQLARFGDHIANERGKIIDDFVAVHGLNANGAILVCTAAILRGQAMHIFPRGLANHRP